jgi:cbb3-type cytochrome oxidase subunit 3
MSVPSIDQLQELAPPSPVVSYWPQTWAWALLAVVLLLAVTAWAFWRYWKWRQARYRREALALLDDLAVALNDPSRRLAALRQLPALIKRVALSAPGGEGSASLRGVDWQAFMQARSPVPLPGDFDRQLALLAYAPDASIRDMDARDAQALLSVCRQWVEVHHVAA